MRLNSFRASPEDATSDLRFTYCACAASTILGDWNGVDRQKTVAYIEECFVSMCVSVSVCFGTGIGFQ